MKRFATKSLVMAAALVAVAVGASAQSMKAEIPFAFRAGGAVLAPGSYRVSVSSRANNSVIHLTSRDTNKSILILSLYKSDVSNPAGDPKLWFACAGGNCVLTSVWNGEDHSAMVVGYPARAAKETAEIRVVTLTAVKAE